jgi:SAM-dependent methyltransferase
VFLPLHPERSAAGGHQWVARSARLCAELFPRSWTVLDYGCGLMRNTHYLASHFRDAAGAETGIQIDRVRTLAGAIPLHRIRMRTPPQFDLVCIFSVLHILASDAARLAAVADALRFLRTGGELMIDVPVNQNRYSGPKAAEKFVRFNDGFVLKGGTFYKLFNFSGVRSLLERAGLEILEWWPEPNNAIARCRKKRLQLADAFATLPPCASASPSLATLAADSGATSMTATSGGRSGAGRRDAGAGPVAR